MTHWTDDLSNVPASVRQQLRNIARETDENMQLVLSRYATERLMYRLSRSEYRDRFVLKGAWLFYLWEINRRATRDVDFLASIGNAGEEVKDVFRQVVEVDVPHDDGLELDPETFRVEEIQEDGDYAGVRLKMTVALGDTTIPTQVDLGFDEALAEEPVRVRLPVLLDYEAPEIKVYGPGAVVAEKLEAVVRFGTINTRLKDFFDLYVLSSERSFEAENLQRQVAATFSHRATEIPSNVPGGLSDEFARDPKAQTQWTAFIRRSEAERAPERFRDVVTQVREFGYPVLKAVAGKEELAGRWSPDEGWG